MTSSEPDDGEDDGNTIDVIVIVDDFSLQLRAERPGARTGRTYTITYLGMAACGTSGLSGAAVTVPLREKAG